MIFHKKIVTILLIICSHANIELRAGLFQVATRTFQNARKIAPDAIYWGFPATFFYKNLNLSLDKEPSYKQPTEHVARVIDECNYPVSLKKIRVINAQSLMPSPAAIGNCLHLPLTDEDYTAAEQELRFRDDARFKEAAERLGMSIDELKKASAFTNYPALPLDKSYDVIIAHELGHIHKNFLTRSLVAYGTIAAAADYGHRTLKTVSPFIVRHPIFALTLKLIFLGHTYCAFLKTQEYVADTEALTRINDPEKLQAMADGFRAFYEMDLEAIKTENPDKYEILTKYPKSYALFEPTHPHPLKRAERFEQAAFDKKK